MLNPWKLSRSMRMEQKCMAAVREYCRAATGYASGYGRGSSASETGVAKEPSEMPPSARRELYYYYFFGARGLASSARNPSKNAEAGGYSSESDVEPKAKTKRRAVRYSSESDAESEDRDEIENPLYRSSLLGKDGKHSNEQGFPGLWLQVRKAAKPDSAISVDSVLEDWVKEGKEITREMVVGTVVDLKRNRRYHAALKVLEWVMREKPFPIKDVDYGYQVDLVSKLHGLRKAKSIFDSIPTEFKTQVVYGILLTCYVQSDSVKLAEGLFEEIKNLGVELSCYMYNQLLLLHKRKGGANRILQLVKEMETKHIEADNYTYNILLSLKAWKGDVDAMENIASIMKDKNVTINASSYCMLAKGYTVAGLKDKAEQSLVKAEACVGKPTGNHYPYYQILEQYASIGNNAKVEEIWKTILDSPKSYLNDYTKMIEALGKMGKVERAEQIFNEMWQSKGIGRVKQVNALLSVYANQGMLSEAEKLMKKLSEESLIPNSITYHQLARLYTNLGLGDKVIELFGQFGKVSPTSIRFRASKNRPMIATFNLILKMFSEKGDVANAEKTVTVLKTVGYRPSTNAYSILLNAYVKAGTAPSGFLDRMQKDGTETDENIISTLKKLKGT